MKHSMKKIACFTTFAISTGAQNFLESAKSEKFSEMTNYSIIPTKPTKSDTKKKFLLTRSNNQIRKLQNPEYATNGLTNQIVLNEKTTTITKLACWST